MRKGIVIGIAAALVWAGTAAAASSSVYVFPRLNQTSYGYQQREYKPRTITLPDRRQAVDIRWTGWGTRRAVGVGHVIYQPHNRLDRWQTPGSGKADNSGAVVHPWARTASTSSVRSLFWRSRCALDD